MRRMRSESEAPGEAPVRHVNQLKHGERLISLTGRYPIINLEADWPLMLKAESFWYDGVPLPIEPPASQYAKCHNVWVRVRNSTRYTGKILIYAGSATYYTHEFRDGADPIEAHADSLRAGELLGNDASESTVITAIQEACEDVSPTHGRYVASRALSMLQGSRQ